MKSLDVKEKKIPEDIEVLPLEEKKNASFFPALFSAVWIVLGLVGSVTIYELLTLKYDGNITRFALYPQENNLRANVHFDMGTSTRMSTVEVRKRFVASVLLMWLCHFFRFYFTG